MSFCCEQQVDARWIGCNCVLVLRGENWRTLKNLSPSYFFLYKSQCAAYPWLATVNFVPQKLSPCSADSRESRDPLFNMRCSHNMEVISPTFPTPTIKIHESFQSSETLFVNSTCTKTCSLCCLTLFPNKDNASTLWVNVHYCDVSHDDVNEQKHAN